MAILISEHDGDVVVGLEGEDDNLSAIHNNVVLQGLGGADVLVSEATADGTVMDGGAGNDILAGGGTNDTASYASASAGVSVNLSALEASDDGSGGIDFLLGIENVTGSSFNDVLIGDDGANVLRGAGGDDVVTGGGGADVYRYSFTFTPGEGETFSFTEYFAERGGSVVNEEVANGTSQGQFSSLYTQWLEMLVAEHGLGTKVLAIGQNSGAGGTPLIENMTGEFGERESFTWTLGSGKKAVSHERWYSDTWSAGGGEDSVTSDDGLDIIVGFGADDVLDFSGITEQQFLAHFSVDSSQNVTQGAAADTVITISGASDWSLTLADVSLSLTQVADQTVFS